MTGWANEDVTFVLRLWLEPDDERPRARLLRTDDDTERTAVGTPAIVQLVTEALDTFLDRRKGKHRDAGATRSRRWRDAIATQARRRR